MPSAVSPKLSPVQASLVRPAAVHAPNAIPEGSPGPIGKPGTATPAASASAESLRTVRGTPNKLGLRFQELRALLGVPVRERFDSQIEAMEAELGRAEPVLDTVRHKGRLLLSRIGEHIRSGRIDPKHVRIRTSQDAPPAPVVDRTLRVGVYPVAADPFQWAHLLIAMEAMAEFQLDKVVFVLAGDDPRKPHMTPASFRHAMGRAVLAVFAPLFAASSIAMGTVLDGETNIMRMLRLNPEQSIHAFYIVGGDHYRFKDAKGNDDTLLKIEKHLAAPGTLDPSKHKVSVAFIERDAPLQPLPTPLDVHFLKSVGFEASSTLVRNGRYELMPHAAYEYVRRHRPGLYGIKERVP